ncbi:hypothetical protein EV214_13723 [Marinisporobacter balticus]|uniref:Uncharacterized protein n=1 Tax=Marinisporobacter balticus TaxID=2018667 RepID=A0A4R2K6M9_9FIRM|nr:hypothetical protein EV214_13723 [Marinisporobacter balticus]
MKKEEKTLLQEKEIKLEDFTIFSGYEILEDGTKVFSAED